MDGDPRGRLGSATELGVQGISLSLASVHSPARRAELRGLRMQMYNRITFMLVEPDGQVAVCKIV